MFLTQRSQESLDICLETFDCIGGRVNFREKKCLEIPAIHCVGHSLLNPRKNGDCYIKFLHARKGQHLPPPDNKF